MVVEFAFPKMRDGRGWKITAQEGNDVSLAGWERIRDKIR
jgi:hypothetical protein